MINIASSKPEEIQQYGLLASARIFFIYLSLISGISPIHNLVPTIEHFPYGLILAALFLDFKFWRWAMVFGITVFYFSSYVYFSTKFSGYGVDYNYLIKSLNVISPFFYVSRCRTIIARAAYHVFFLYIGFGVLQFVGLLEFASGFFSFLIARFNEGTGDGYRGVSMLETEPSRASFQLIVLMAMAQLYKPKRELIILAICVAAQLILIRSTTGILLTLMFAAIVYGTRMFNFYGLLALFFAFVMVAVYAPQNPKVALVISLYEQQGFAGAYTGLAATSGGRFLASMQTTGEIVRWPFGYGANPDFLDAEKEETLEYQVSGYRSRISAQPVSIGLNMLYVYGVFLIIPFWINLKQSSKNFGLSTSAVAVMLLGMIYSPPGSEAWLTAILMLVHGRRVREPNAAVKKPRRPRNILMPRKKIQYSCE